MLRKMLRRTVLMAGSSLVSLLLAELALHRLSTAQAQGLSEVTSWAYQLQNSSPAALAESSFDLVVMDYSEDGSAAGESSAEDIQTIKDSGKIVLSYLSIGEAEDYRFYFSSSWIQRKSGAPCRKARTAKAPVWLDSPNREWCGNYKTRFWNRRWQRIIFGRREGAAKSYLDRIIDAGFDGVYLDIIDGYEYWLEKPAAQRRRSAAQDMANFVIAIANYARVSRGKSGFIVVPQNGAGILGELSASKRASYLAAIDGIGAEDTFYFGDRDEDNALSPQSALENLREFRAAGKVVLAIDYLTASDKITDFVSRACAEGFIPQVSVRALDTLESHTELRCE